MKIAFLTSCLEPNYDGVGDYTRALALECNRFKYPSRIFALKDRFIDTAEISRREMDEQSGLTTIRYHNVFDGNANNKFMRDLADWNPEWVSLQFVGYGFHPKGIVFTISDKLKKAIDGRKLHIMLHEIWIGDSVEYGWKDRAIGYFQKRSIVKLIRKIRPRIISTSNPVFRYLLNRNGINAEELPIFGNIQIVANPIYEETYRLLNYNGFKIEANKREKYVLAGFFGTIHPGWNPDVVFGQLLKTWKKLKKIPIIISMGRMGERGANIWNYLNKHYCKNIHFINVGEQSSGSISTIMQTLDFGITTTPLALAGKSGSVAAMVDHGLPVLFLRDDWVLRSGPTPSSNENLLYHKLDSNFAKKLASGLKRGIPQSTRERIARQFITNLDY